MVKKLWKYTKRNFSSVIYHTNIKDISDTIITTNSHLENYWKQQNFGFTDNGNIRKSDLNTKG